MGPKLDNEPFYKLLKLFFRGFHETFLSQIHKSDFVFDLQCSKKVIPIYSQRFEYPVKINSDIQLEIRISSKNFDWLWSLNLMMNFSIYY